MARVAQLVSIASRTLDRSETPKLGVNLRKRTIRQLVNGILAKFLVERRPDKAKVACSNRAPCIFTGAKNRTYTNILFVSFITTPLEYRIEY